MYLCGNLSTINIMCTLASSTVGDCFVHQHVSYVIPSHVRPVLCDDDATRRYKSEGAIQFCLQLHPHGLLQAILYKNLALNVNLS
jgi:hypothetical protein